MLPDSLIDLSLATSLKNVKLWKQKNGLGKVCNSYYNKQFIINNGYTDAT